MSTYPKKIFDIRIGNGDVVPVRNPRQLFEKYQKGDIIPTSESGTLVPLKVTGKSLTYKWSGPADTTTFRLHIEKHEVHKEEGLTWSTAYNYSIETSSGTIIPHESIPEIDYIFGQLTVGDRIFVKGEGSEILSLEILKKDELRPPGSGNTMRTLTVADLS
ncbi:hypothetical protein ACIPZ5_04870 [Pseudomonas sp. NPDC089428]|uniref:hypothetical protein n=1 Tax=Pseudomonas sp. NPDC089428 TaxID=3364467 RepID=UPI00381A3792